MWAEPEKSERPPAEVAWVATPAALAAPLVTPTTNVSNLETIQNQSVTYSDAFCKMFFIMSFAIPPSPVGFASGF